MKREPILGDVGLFLCTQEASDLEADGMPREPEVEILQGPEDGRWTVYRFTPERCSWTANRPCAQGCDGRSCMPLGTHVLSDNPFHPRYPVWFADHFDHGSDQDANGASDDLRTALCSKDAEERARAYWDIGTYFGLENLDSYPLILKASEVAERYGPEWCDDDRLVGPDDIDEFVDEYIETLLWLTSAFYGSGSGMEDLFDGEDLSEEDRATIVADCESFLESSGDDLAGLDYEDGRYSNVAKAAHDFCLTRNGHGVGFWDRGLGKLGDKLSEASKAFGPQTVETDGLKPYLLDG